MVWEFFAGKCRPKGMFLDPVNSNRDLHAYIFRTEELGSNTIQESGFDNSVSEVGF